MSSRALAACVVTGCALFPSVDGLTVQDAAVDTDGAADGSLAPDARVIDATEDASPVWSTITLVQAFGSNGTSMVSFAKKTTAGNLLVAMQPATDPPSGAGWVPTTSQNGDCVFLWPDNPGGLQTFTLTDGTDGDNDVILAELSGVPSKLSLDFETDTNGKGATVTALSVTGKTPRQPGELLFAYLDTNAATSAVVAQSGWQSLGTDGDNDFGWWAATGPAATTLMSTFAPSSPGSLMLVGFDAP